MVQDESTLCFVFYHKNKLYGWNVRSTGSVVIISIIHENKQQVSNGHWFDPGRQLLSDAALAQW